MRRKPMSQGNGGGYNNQQRKQRYQGGGQGHNQGQHNNRPRKNYPALREKYLTQARDALASGDRVLAENYFQHAEHCYRMMVEEGYNTRNNYTPPAAATETGAEGGTEAQAEQTDEASSEDAPLPVGSQLPAFLTANFEQPELPHAVGAAAEPVIVQNWEE